MADTFRALCAELVNELADFQWAAIEAGVGWAHPDTETLITRARAALAEADKPAVPEGGEPTRDELWDLWLRLNNEMPDRPAAVAEFWEHACVHARARWGNPAPAPLADVSQLSDGYHTFAELYEHRYSLMLALMRAQPHICWFSRRHADGELPFGSDDWFIVGAELPGAPITYHLPSALYSLAQKTGALELPTGRPWDGHSAADVVQRLRDWAIAPAPPADGEVADVVRWLRSRAGIPASPDFPAVAAYLTRAAELLQRQALVPVSVSDALIKAECALSDIAEGEPMTDEGDPLQWAERRCADTLAIIRPTMRQHKIRTSEWPPAPAPPCQFHSNRRPTMADLTPEHTSRRTEGDLHPEVREAYRYVDSVVATADFERPLAWCGWALREAFLAGCTHARAALADEPAAPAPPADGELLKLAQQYSVVYLCSDGSACNPFQDGYDMRGDLLAFARAVWALAGNPEPAPPADGEVAELVADHSAFASWLAQEMPPGTIIGDPYWWAPRIARRAAELLQRQALVPAPPADGEVAELVAWLEEGAGQYTCLGFEDLAAKCARAAELLQRQALVPVPVSERLPEAQP